MTTAQQAIGLRSCTRTDAPGIRVEVVAVQHDGSHEAVAHVDYTPEQAAKVVAAMLRCMGKTMAVIDE